MKPSAFALIILSVLSASSAWAVDHPFGVMVGVNGHKPDEIFSAVKQTGAIYFRPPEVMVDEWIRNQGRCRECPALQQSGLKILLTVRNNGHNAKGTDRRPSTPPKDLAAYKRAVGEILDAYKPELLIVENEENATPFYYDGTRLRIWDSPGDGIDTADAYAKELAAACEAAHERKVACANGGLTSDATAAVTWFHYLKAGKTKEACAFAKRAFYTRSGADMAADFCNSSSPASVPAPIRQLIERIAMRLVKIYAESPIDYVNIHWYIRDPEALREAAAFLRETTGKPVMTNEIGQWEWDAAAKRVQPLMQAVLDAKLAYAVWFSVDVGHAKGLFNSDGTLRENGRAFRDFIAELGAR